MITSPWLWIILAILLAGLATAGVYVWARRRGGAQPQLKRKKPPFPGIARIREGVTKRGSRRREIEPEPILLRLPPWWPLPWPRDEVALGPIIVGPMAVDTASKRGSAINISCPWRGIFPFPDAVIDQGDRQQTAFMFSGQLAGPPTVATPIGISSLSGLSGLQGIIRGDG